MKKIITLISLVFALAVVTVNANIDVRVEYNGNLLEFTEPPLVMNNKTLVQLRPIAEAMNLDISFSVYDGSVVLSNEETTVIFKNNLAKKLVNGIEYDMDVPMIQQNYYSFVPVRDLVEPFGLYINYDGETKTVVIKTPDNKPTESTPEPTAEPTQRPILKPLPNPTATPVVKPEPNPPAETPKPQKYEIPETVSTGSGKYDYTYFTQSQSDLGLLNNGRGYCWVCSYAMIFSEILDKVITPAEVANFNIEEGFVGNFMANHQMLLNVYGLEFVPALREDSKYFLEFGTSFRGETKIAAETEEDVVAALKEALDNHKHGVIVRFDAYPHSMVAVGYEDDTIYFNDPGVKDGEHVTFSKTCLKNYKLTDLSYIQAIEIK